VSAEARVVVVPSHPENFIMQFSERLASLAPQLTLNFMTEICTGHDKLSQPVKIHSARFITPWVKNLAFFADPTHELYDQSGARLRECLRAMVDLTSGDQEVRFSMFCGGSALNLP
jgi:hypothetical protein